VMERRGLAGAVFNAAKERALDHFIAKRLPFMGMAEVVEAVLARIEAENGLIDAGITLETVGHVDHLARMATDQVVQDKYS